MQKEAHETGRNDRIADPEVPRCPLRLEPIKLAEVGVGVQHLGRLVGGGGRVHRGDLKVEKDEGQRYLFCGRRCSRTTSKVGVAKRNGAVRKPRRHLDRSPIHQLVTTCNLSSLTEL